jgi:hypothetical protein
MWKNRPRLSRKKDFNLELLFLNAKPANNHALAHVETIPVLFARLVANLTSANMY